MNIAQNKVMAGRKNAMAFHTRHSVKGVDEIRLHELPWTELNRLRPAGA
jgi:hypothetical protein